MVENLKNWLFPPDETRVLGFYVVNLIMLIVLLCAVFLLIMYPLFGWLFSLFVLLPVMLIGPLFAMLFTIFPVASSILLVLIGIIILPYTFGVKYLPCYGILNLPNIVVLCGVISIVQVYMEKRRWRERVKSMKGRQS